MRPALSRLRTGLVMLGPAFVAAVAYVDPGNVASNSEAGSRYGYLLVWVVIVANVMAGLVQYLSAKLGVVTGRSLPEVLRDRLGTGWRLAYWAQAELVAMATDLAEVLGGAIALYLLFGVPPLLGGLITGVVSMALLGVQHRRGQRQFERVITAMLLITAFGFLAGLVVSPPSASGTLHGLLPRFDGASSILIATSMLGATVMPHAIYLHSALARDRHGKQRGRALRRVLRHTRFDVGIAMIVAGGVNLAMVLLAASALRGQQGLGSLEGVYRALSDTLGGVVGVLFAVGLLAAGLASTSVGCYAGSVVAGGLLRVRFPIAARRLVTLLPALALLAAGANPTWTLLMSQVVLSFGTPFALVPLVRLTASSEVMGGSANARTTTVLATVVITLIIALNVALLWFTVT